MIAGMQKEYRYDHLVVALGSIARVVPIPGLVEHAIGFKTIAEATALRNRIIRQIEVAEGIDDPDSRRVYLELCIHRRRLRGARGNRRAGRLRPRRDPPLPPVSRGRHQLHPDRRGRSDHARGSARARRLHAQLLRSRGIEFRLGVHVTEVRDDSITLSTGETLVVSNRRLDGGRSCEPFRLPARAAAGPRPNRVRRVHARRGLSQRLGARRHRGRPGPRTAGMPCPPTAQHAIRQGKLIGAQPRRGDAASRRDRSPSRRSGCLPSSARTERSRTSWGSS